jgi:hypothetical protein
MSDDTEARRRGLVDHRGMRTSNAITWRRTTGESSASRAVVVVPLLEGAGKRAAELLRNGPPFDPDEVGLGRHQVFLTDSEVIFLFEADSAQTADNLLSNPRLWEAASAWKDLVAGPPELAEDVYSWSRVKRDDYLSSEPTPGPGDSDGGDIF